MGRGGKFPSLGYSPRWHFWYFFEVSDVFVVDSELVSELPTLRIYVSHTPLLPLCDHIGEYQHTVTDTHTHTPWYHLLVRWKISSDQIADPSHVRSPDMWRQLRIELLLLCVDRGLSRWFEHLISMFPVHSPSEISQGCPTGRRPRGRPGRGNASEK